MYLNFSSIQSPRSSDKWNRKLCAFHYFEYKHHIIVYLHQRVRLHSGDCMRLKYESSSEHLMLPRSQMHNIVNIVIIHNLMSCHVILLIVKAKPRYHSDEKVIIMRNASIN